MYNMFYKDDFIENKQEIHANYLQLCPRIMYNPLPTTK